MGGIYNKKELYFLYGSAVKIALKNVKLTFTTIDIMNEIEKRAKEKGIIGVVLGTDDEKYKTSLSKVDLNNKNIFTEIENIKNINHHPFEFYQKCGYFIVGVIPNANGKNKPDIWMWKEIQ